MGIYIVGSRSACVPQGLGTYSGVDTRFETRGRVGVSESMRGKVGTPVSFTILLNALVTRSKSRMRGFLRPSMAQKNVS